MKVIQINVLCFTQSTGKIVKDIDATLTKEGVESLVFYGRKPVFQNNKTYKFCTELESYFQSLLFRVGITLEYGGCNFATWRLIRRLKKENPDVVHLHCLNGSCVNIYQLLCFLGKNKIKTVVTHHAEFYYTGSCPHAYECFGFADDECSKCPTPRVATRNRIGNRAHEAWRKMRDAFGTFDKNNLVFTAVSPWVKERSSLSPIVNKYPCEVVLNGVDIEVFNRKPISHIIRERINYSGKVLLFVASIFSPMDKEHIKGGAYIVELAKRMPQSQFIVVANYIRETKGLPSNIHIWGRASSQEELVKLYCSVDLTLIASRRETFCMVVAESLCCGTPVVGFNAGGPESIALKDYTKFVDYGNLDKYEIAVKQMLNENFDRERISQESKVLYGRQSMAQGYVDIYKSFFN
jgi:glycosyltransferase involved in cell wall biosynthesis